MKSRYILFLLPVACLIIFACTMSDNDNNPIGSADPITGTITGSIEHNGTDRSYILYVPENYDGTTAVPLVLNFHGYTSNAKDQMNYGDFRPLADQEGFIVVHPEGTLLDGKTHWNVGGWTVASKIDDVDFTNTLLDHLSTKYKIDAKRVYSTGMSNGGYMSFLLACQLSDRIAAVASVTGSMTPQMFSSCDPKHPTPVLQIHGTSDNVVPYTGAMWTKSIEEVTNYWINYNNCSKEGATTVLPDTNPNDGSTVEHILYDSGTDGAVTQHYRVLGGGHTWPGAGEGYGKTNYDIEAVDIIWDFFGEYDLDGVRE